MHGVGLLYDREWALIDEKNNYLNQKKVVLIINSNISFCLQIPQMCLIRPHIDSANDVMTIDAPSMPTLSLSLSAIPDKEIELVVCGDRYLPFY
jgi:hypothetical protein